MKRRRWLWPIVGAVAVIVLSGVAYFVWQTTREHDFPPMALFQEGDGTSADLATDVKRMWATQPLTGDADPDAGPNPKGSTSDAVAAASRVFNTVELIGKTREEVIALFGDPRASNDSVYNFPFYPAPKGSLVYRFDTGAGGWQFNVLFDSDGRVREVRRYGIE